MDKAPPKNPPQPGTDAWFRWQAAMEEWYKHNAQHSETGKKPN